MAPLPASTHLLNPHSLRTSPIYTLASHTLGSTTLITTAGQIGARPDGSVPTHLSQQITQALSNLSATLYAAGATIPDILKLTYYIVDYDHTQPVQREHLLAFLGDHRPPMTLIPVTKLARPEFLFEIEAVAAVSLRETEKVDVVVVGAGLSGLATAVGLSKEGVKVRVVEARERVGGKTWSREVLGGKSVADVGAAWINDSNQERMWGLVQRYGLETVRQNVEGRIVCDEGIGRFKTHPYGELVADERDREEVEEIVMVREALEAACQRVDIRRTVETGRRVREDIDGVTLEEWIRSVGGGESALNAYKVGTRAMLGVEPGEVSALYFLDYCKSGGGYLQMRSDKEHGGQYLRLAEGVQMFSRRLAEELPADSLLLMSPVRRIQKIEGGYRVYSPRGVFEAARVVVSVPTPLYKEIVFDPPLPKEKLELSQTTKLGDYCKMITFYRTPWWREHGLCGMTQSCHGPAAVTRDSSVDQHGHYSLTSFVTGQPAREWMKLDSEKRKQAVIDQIEKLFAPFAKVEQPVEVLEQIWRNEQWSQGCPCPVLGPGGLTRFEQVLRAPVEGIHFVGTETSYEWKGYMEGAVRSGERGAEEVLSSLKSA